MARAAKNGTFKLIHAGLVDWAIMADEETPEGHDRGNSSGVPPGRAVDGAGDAATVDSATATPPTPMRKRRMARPKIRSRRMRTGRTSPSRPFDDSHWRETAATGLRGSGGRTGPRLPSMSLPRKSRNLHRRKRPSQPP